MENEAREKQEYIIEIDNLLQMFNTAVLKRILLLIRGMV